MSSVADQIQLGIVEEVTYGVDPATTRQLLRITGEGLETVMATAQSGEITGDRQVVDLIRTDQSVRGPINFELSAEAFDLPFQGFLCASALGDNGEVLRSFTLERQYTDLSTISAIFTGCLFDGLNLNVRPGQIITGNFDVIGKSEAAGTGMTAPTAAPTNPVLNAVTNITAITEGGSAVSLLGLTMQARNNVRGRPLIGTLGPSASVLGQFLVTGTIEAYFATATLYNKFLNQTGSTLSVSAQVAAGKGYKFDLHNIKYTSGQRFAGGINQDIIVRMGFTALKKVTSTFKTMSITALTS